MFIRYYNNFINLHQGEYLFFFDNTKYVDIMLVQEYGLNELLYFKMLNMYISYVSKIYKPIFEAEELNKELKNLSELSTADELIIYNLRLVSDTDKYNCYVKEKVNVFSHNKELYQYNNGVSIPAKHLIIVD